MKNSQALAMFLIFGLTLTVFVLLLNYHHERPVVYTLTGEKTPISEHEPMPAGADPAKWQTAYSHKIVGEISNFNPKAYQTQYPHDIVIAHKEGSFTIYTKFKPDPNFFPDGFIVVKE